MIKNTTLLILALCVSDIYTIDAQIAKPTTPTNVSTLPAKVFFWPASGKNKASFYLPGKGGEHTFIARTIYYMVNAKPSDTAMPVKAIPTGNVKKTGLASTDTAKPTLAETYQITDISKYGEMVTCTEKYVVQFTESEVQVVSSTITNALETNAVYTYEHPITLLKLPRVGQRAVWAYTDRMNTNYKCTSEWMTMPIDGVAKKVIKVTVASAEDANAAKTILYYVQGVGLWKTESVSPTGVKEIKDQFDGLDYESISGN